MAIREQPRANPSNRVKFHKASEVDHDLRKYTVIMPVVSRIFARSDIRSIYAPHELLAEKRKKCQQTETNLERMLTIGDS